MTKKSIKDDILTILKKEGRLTVAKLSEYFKVSDIALRRHIHTLERDGLLKATIEKQSLGRPYYIFELTDKGKGLFPSNYQQFSLEILEHLETLKGKEFVYQLLVSHLENQRHTYEQRLTGEDFETKVNQLARIQEEKGYMTELENNENDSYTLKQYNCPIFSVANQYHNVCTQEAKLFQDVLDFDVSLTTCIANGAHSCNFVIEND